MIPPELVYRRLTWCAAVLLAVVVATSARAERPRADHLLPDNTLAMVSVVNAPDAAARFMNTALGRMSQDPQMKPLVQQLYGSLGDLAAEVKDSIGLTLSELLAIPQGEVTIAVIPCKDAPPAVVVLLDVGSQLANAQRLLGRGTAALDQSGVKKSEETIGGTKITVYDGVGPQQRKVAYFEKDATYAIASDPEVLKRLLATFNGEKTATLSQRGHYATLMSRCRGGKDEQPQVLWYVDPIGLLRAFGQETMGARLVIAMLPALGVDGLSGLGGTIALDAGQFDAVMHAHLLLENPRSGVVKMIALEPGDFKPEPWVPSDVANYTTLHWNVETTYKALATVYDSFRGEGALAKDVQQRLAGTTGIDFQKELLPSLEGRITILTWIERPVTLQSQVQLYALKLKNTELAGKAIDKLVEKYPEMLSKKTCGGKTYFQLQSPRPPDSPPGEGPPLPCFGILDDYLMMATRSSLYEKIVAALGSGGKSLADELDFKLVSSKIQRQSGGAKPAMISFNRPEERIRFWYDLATAERTKERLNRSAENNRFFKSIDTALKQNPLPPFEVLQRYLAPGGAVIVDDETGIHYTAFSLRRKTE